ncbi:MAG: HEAT repeat domain-containing protein [Planctomycetes bacterium]|nr:HEAT repeat domain-containing protein [Planctomycetota bacterium]
MDAIARELRAGKNQASAAEALGKIGPHAATAVDALLDTLKAPSKVLRAASATALGRISPQRPDVHAALERVAKDDEPSVRRAASVALDQGA